MKPSKSACNLESCFLCRSVTKSWCPALQAGRKTLDVKKGGLIFSEGDPVSGIYFMNSGLAKVHKRWGDDKELIIRFADAGAIVGHRGLGGDATYPVSATALEPSTVCFIGMELFHDTLRVNPGLTLRLLLFMADELRESEQKMRNLAHMSVKGRLARALLQLAAQFGVDEEGFLRHGLSRQDLSSYAGATYETVFRVINELVADGVIGLSGKAIRILNRDGLLSLSSANG